MHKPISTLTSLRKGFLALALAVLFLGIGSSQVWATKISALDDGGTVETTDNIPVERSGDNYRVVVGSMAPQDADAVDISGGDINGLTTLSVGSVSSTEINYLDGVTSAIQTQLDARQPLDPELTALAGVTSAADKLFYFTGSETGAVTTFTAAARGLVDDATTSDMRTTLGLAIGTNVQAYDPELAALAGLTSAADKVAYFTGSGTAALTDLTSAARTVIDDTTVSAMVNTLGGATATGTAGTGLVFKTSPTLSAFLGINANTAVLPTPGTGTIFQLQGADASILRQDMFSYGNSTVIFAQRANGTPSTTLTGLLLDENSLNLAAGGYGSTGYTSNARGSILFSAAENWTDSAQGMYITFRGTTTGAAAIAEWARFYNANFKVGGTATRGTTEGAAHIDLFNGTAPVGTLTNGVSLYSSSGDLLTMNALGWARTVSGAVSAQNGGDTNNSASGSGSFFDHNLTYTIPANVLIANKVLRVTVMLSVTTGSAAPTLTTRLKAGSTVIYQQNGTGTPSNNQTGVNVALSFIIQGTAAAGAAANVLTTSVGIVNSVNAAANYSSVAQPVALATNGTLAVAFGTQWGSAGTGTNTVTLNSLIVEALN